VNLLETASSHRQEIGSEFEETNRFEDCLSNFTIVDVVWVHDDIYGTDCKIVTLIADEGYTFGELINVMLSGNIGTVIGNTGIKLTLVF